LYFKTLSSFVLLVNFTCTTALAESKTILSAQEEKISAYVVAKLPQTLNSLEQAVNINSGSLNLAGVKQVGDLMMAQYDALGFQTQWLDGSAFNRAGHLVATWQSKNENAKKILMIGHLDTVFSKSDGFQKFKRLNNNEVAGPGIVDMKGGNAIIFAALSALKELKLLDKLSIQVVLTGDEESSGRPLSLSKKAIVDGGIWADIALGFENGDSDINTAMVARRGYSSWTLDVTAKPAHSSQIFRKEVGFGAIYETARILDTFRLQLAEQPNLTFNPGLILGGTSVAHDVAQSKGQAFGKANVIAQTVKVSGDIRALSQHQLLNAQQAMQSIVQGNLAQTDAKLTFESGYPPMSPTSGNKALLAMYNQVSQDLGYNQVIAANPRKAGAADISFAAEHVDMAMDGLGLMGRGAHTKNEVADLSSLQKNIEKAAILLHRLSQESGEK